jgi:hypothetical protein
MSAADTMTVEERLDRAKALMIEMQAIAVAGDDFPGRGIACTTLEIMAAEELAKVRAALGTEVLTGTHDDAMHHAGAPASPRMPGPAHRGLFFARSDRP